MKSKSLENKGGETRNPESSSEWILVNTKTLMGLIGVIAVISWLGLLTSTNALLFRADYTDYQLSVVHGAAFFGILLGLIAAYLFSDRISKKRAMPFSISAVIALLSFFGVAFSQINELNLTLLIVSMAANGAALGSLYPLYGEYLSVIFNREIEWYVKFAFLFVTAICACRLFIKAQISGIFVVCIAVIAYIGYMSQLKYWNIDSYEPILKADSRDRRHITIKSYLSTATAGFVFGYGSGFCIILGGNYPAVDLISFLATLLVSVYLFVDSIKWHHINEYVTMRFFLLFSAAFAFPIIFVPDQLKYLFAVLLVCWALFPLICSISALCRHIAFFRLSGVADFSLGRLYSIFGMVCGCMLSFFACTDVGYRVIGSTSVAFSVCVFMVLVIVSCSFIMTEDNYPTDERVRLLESSGGDDSSSIGNPLLQKNDASKVRDSFDDEHPRVFHEKVAIVAKRYGLTKRQQEVLAMLAKGRNAEYITEKLVISPHTAKAHIYNIYTKMDVHSRQELMDIVEDTDVPPDNRQ